MLFAIKTRYLLEEGGSKRSKKPRGRCDPRPSHFSSFLRLFPGGGDITAPPHPPSPPLRPTCRSLSCSHILWRDSEDGRRGCRWCLGGGRVRMGEEGTLLGERRCLYLLSEDKHETNRRLGRRSCYLFFSLSLLPLASCHLSSPLLPSSSPVLPPVT